MFNYTKKIRIIFYFIIVNSYLLAQNYTYKTPARDGIGKVYLGREISKIMGHQGAEWLERNSREIEEKPSVVIKNLKLKSSDIVADFGSGSGYFTRLIAPKCSLVYAIDIQKEMHDINKFILEKNNINNVKFILGESKKTNLPKNKIYILIMVDVYHELEFPYEIMSNIYNILKKNGKVVLVEYKGEDKKLMIKPLHKMTIDQIILEMENVGLKFEKQIDKLPKQHMLMFTK